MTCAFLYRLLLFHCLTGGPPDTSYLENIRQLMTDIRNNRIMSDTLFISRQAYPLHTEYCEELWNDTVNLTAAERLELHSPTHDTLIKTWTSDLVGGAAYLVKSDSLIEATKVMGPNNFDFYLNIKGGLWSFSTPLFLRHGELCLIEISSYSGPMSASNRLSLFKKINGHWKEVRFFCSGIS